MKHRKSKSQDCMNILFTCIGRRVSLLNAFRNAAKQMRKKACFFGTDTTQLSSALQICDKGFLVKPITHIGYIKELLSIVKKNRVKLLIPTIDTELKILAANASKFADINCRVLISDEKVINICQDKRQTYKFLIKNGFDCPVTMSTGSALSKAKLDWPCYVKPWDGSAGKEHAIAFNRRDLLFYAKKIPNGICQEFLTGDEFTCDVYVDFDMKVRCVVPRKRLEVRSGEVSKSRIVKKPHIMKRTTELVKALGAGPGVITVQLFRTPKGKLKFLEINPRFGGGIPLSIKAGANFPKWILAELSGKKLNITSDDFIDGLIMLRYDSEVWLND